MPIPEINDAENATLREDFVVPQRRVFFGEEHGDINVPLNLIMKGVELDLYEDVLSRNFFRVFLRGKKLVLQAGGFLGLIPINENVSVEVRSRVPVRNLERLLWLASGYAPEILPAHLRTFGMADVATPSLLDILAFRLLQAVDSIRAEGLHFEYAQRTHFNSSPCGRILPFESVKRQIGTGRRSAIAFTAFKRTFDTAANRCLRSALRRLFNAYCGMRNRRGARMLASRLGIAEAIFSAANLDPSQLFLFDRVVSNPLLLPESKSAYAPALAIAKMILQQPGLDIRSQTGDVMMPSVLVNMEDVFERYFRIAISVNLNSPELAVLDGNIAEPAGAARPLFDHADGVLKSNRATPDVLIKKLRPLPCNAIVIDVKYKTSKQPDRDDINQVLVYGNVYGCRSVALAYPRRGALEASVARIGTVAGTDIFKISVDLGTSDLKSEEQRLVDALKPLCQ